MTDMNKLPDIVVGVGGSVKVSCEGLVAAQKIMKEDQGDGRYVQTSKNAGDIPSLDVSCEGKPVINMSCTTKQEPVKEDKKEAAVFSCPVIRP